MIYCLIRNKALQVGIRAMSVLSGPKPGELPVVFEWYVESPLMLVALFVCCSQPLLVLLVRSEMAAGSGRNDDAIAAALSAVAQALAHNQGNGGHGQEDQGEVVERRLDRFMRNKPPTFKGRFNPEGALTWMEGIERILRAMVTNDDQKVRLATHMLAEEAEYWWTSTKRRIEASGDAITWVRFKNEFLKKYFSEDFRNK